MRQVGIPPVLSPALNLTSCDVGHKSPGKEECPRVEVGVFFKAGEEGEE